MKKTKKQIELSVTDDLALAQYENARAELEHFMKEHEEVFEHFSALTEVYNTSLEQADKTMRAKSLEYDAGVSCGPFRFKNFRESVDADKLFEAVGDDRFRALGGRIVTVQKYTVDKDVFAARVAGKAVEQSVVDLVVAVTPVYTGPKKINIS